MQLKPKQAARPPAEGLTARRRLMAASCALLGATVARAESARAAPAGGGLLDDWSLDSALAYYHEDGRVQAVEPVVAVSKAFADGETLEANFTFDALSGASPNGALTSRTAQTFASPSGKSLTAGRHTYTIAPGQLPADPDYSDARVAVGANWSVPVTRVTQVSVGGKLSYEDDFYSATVNASIAHDFNDKNTTLSFGINNEFDALSPIGGTPVAGSNYASFEKAGNKTKDGVGALLGVTQVMTRHWLTEFNLSVDRFKGYENDPYKITSLIDAAGDTTGYVYESRPDQRTRKSAFWDNRVGWDTLSFAVSARYMSDDWGVRSDTAQLHVRWSLSDRDRFIEPTVRWYRQTAADFYTPWIMNSAAPATGYESSDSRLAAFHALTYGLKYAQKLSPYRFLPGSEFNVRVEYYQQTYHERMAVPQALQGLDLYPGLKAILVQVGWRF
jgi:hypothetical protein